MYVIIESWKKGIQRYSETSTDNINSATDSNNEITDTNDTTDNNDTDSTDETSTDNKLTKADINAKYGIIYNTITKLEKLFDTVDKYKNCYMWHGNNGNTSQRE